MPSRKCISCLPSNKKVAGMTKKRADWKLRKGLKSIFPNDKTPDLQDKKQIQERAPQGANQHIEVNLGKKMKHRIVLYYAAEESPLAHCANCQIKNPKDSYGSFKNQGITTLDGEGNGILKIRCPRPYREENRTYLPHVHFIVSDAKRENWIHKLMTQTVVCQLNYLEMVDVVKSGCSMVINSLPFEYYVKNRIPMSIPLDHNLVLDKLDKKEVIEYLKVMVAHYPKVQKKVMSGKLDLMDIPIVSYCYDAQCEADTDLQMKLNKIGFTNVKLYPGGIKEWLKKTKK